MAPFAAHSGFAGGMSTSARPGGNGTGALWLHLLVVGIGVLLIGVAAWSLKNSLQLRRDGLRAPGEVIDLIRKQDSDGDITWAPLFRFTTASGREIDIVSSISSSPAAYDIGDTVTMLYDPDKPSRARVDGVLSLWGTAIIVGGLGLLFGGIGTGLLVTRVRAWRRARQLDRSAQVVQASLTTIDRIRDDDGSSFRIRAQWLSPHDNTMHVFESPDLPYNPERFLSPDQPIAVRIDPADPANHAMDLGFLPRQAD